MDEFDLRSQFRQIEEMKDYIRWVTQEMLEKNDEVNLAIFNLRREGLYIEVAETLMERYMWRVNSKVEALVERMRHTDWRYLDDVQNDLIR